MPYKALNKSQQKAMEEVVAALKEAVNNSDQAPKADGLIGHDRMNRLFFVSGQPGSGKTSIYVTLCALLTDREFRDQHKGKLNLDGLDGKVRWLEPVDLEVAGDEGENLLAAVLVRISDAIGHSSGMASKACREALDKLNELANDIGIAWDGNLRARAASLDPDSYSQEVMRAQRTRLGINERLRTTLDALLSNKCYGCKGEKVFVLPIDDFYLKPKASLELLRLLRMVSVPRLFLSDHGRHQDDGSAFLRASASRLDQCSRTRSLCIPREAERSRNPAAHQGDESSVSPQTTTTWAKSDNQLDEVERGAQVHTFSFAKLHPHIRWTFVRYLYS